jgi:hypothetical protein
MSAQNADTRDVCMVRWYERGWPFSCHCVLLDGHPGPHRCTCGTAHNDGKEMP